MDDQQLSLQCDALHQADCSVIYKETVIDKAATNRPQLELCRKALRAGDTLVVWRLDRIGRNLSDLVRIVTGLEQAGVTFESITEKIKTGSATGLPVSHLFSMLAEFEHNLIQERTHAGLVRARARGRSGGRKPKLDADQVREIKALLTDSSVLINDIAKRYGVSRTTLYRHAGIYLPQKNEGMANDSIT